MKKRLLIMAIIIISIFIIGIVQSLAAAAFVIYVQGETTVSSGETVELTIILDEWTDIEKGEPLGYQCTISYDEEIFSGISNVEGLNGWTVNYADSTKILIGETESVATGIGITTITLTLQDGLTSGATGTVYFNNMLLTDGGTNNLTVDMEFTVTVEDSDEESAGTGAGSSTETGNTNTSATTNTTNTSATNTDTTTSSKTLPAAGVRNILIMAIAVVIIILLAIIFKIKSRKIKY